MSSGSGWTGWFRRTGREALGWILIPVGVVLWPAPGPGTLVLLAAFTLLAPRYAWAQRIVDRFQDTAIKAAKFGVATWPRIAFSAAGVLWLVALGAVWWASPTIPEFEVLGVGFGPELPAAGWVTAIGLWVSAAAALGLLAYSVLRWREPRDDATTDGSRTV